MSPRDIIVVGASAGGVEALMDLCKDLPARLRATLFVVLHVPASGGSALPRILSRSGPIPASHAVDGEPIRKGRIYVAPPDFHLLLEKKQMRLSRGPRENGHRPAVDPLFRSAASFHDGRVVGVLLSGNGDDGTAGLGAIRSRGGTVLVQDPREALHPRMPQSALDTVGADRCLGVKDLAELIVRLAESLSRADAARLRGRPRPPQEAEASGGIERNELLEEEGSRSGTPSVFTCPDCEGVRWELSKNEALTHRCHAGHPYSRDSLHSGGALDIGPARGGRNTEPRILPLAATRGVLSYSATGPCPRQVARAKSRPPGQNRTVRR